VTAVFPAYEDVLARAGGAAATVTGRDALHAALAGFAVRPGAVLLRTGPGRITLVRRDEEATVAAEHTGPGLEVAVDASFARDAVAAAVGPDVVVEITDALRPVVFRSADDGTFTTMLMPVRLN
jgi:DNA polymerase III beta subunit, C-terminal domain